MYSPASAVLQALCVTHIGETLLILFNNSIERPKGSSRPVFESVENTLPTPTQSRPQTPATLILPQISRDSPPPVHYYTEHIPAVKPVPPTTLTSSWVLDAHHRETAADHAAHNMGLVRMDSAVRPSHHARRLAPSLAKAQRGLS